MSVANNENVGLSGTGTFTQSGGINNCGYLILGYNAGGSGTYNLSGTGYLSAAGYRERGLSGTGTFTQSGGTNNCGASLNLGYNPGSSGTYNLNGGLLILSSLSQGSGAAAFNFSGGTLQAGSGFSTSSAHDAGHQRRRSDLRYGRLCRDALRLRFPVPAA